MHWSLDSMNLLKNWSSKRTLAIAGASLLPSGDWPTEARRPRSRRKMPVDHTAWKPAPLEKRGLKWTGAVHCPNNVKTVRVGFVQVSKPQVGRQTKQTAAGRVELLKTARSLFLAYCLLRDTHGFPISCHAWVGRLGSLCHPQSCLKDAQSFSSRYTSGHANEKEYQLPFPLFLAISPKPSLKVTHSNAA